MITTPFFWGWLLDQLQRKHLSPYRFARRLHVDLHTVLSWRDGAVPRPVLCLRIADLLHVPLAEVYVHAGIPLRAEHEYAPEDWYIVPDLTLTPEIHLFALLPRLGLTDTQIRRVSEALREEEHSRSEG